MKGFYRWAVMAVCACLLALPATAAPYKSEYKLSVVPGATSDRKSTRLNSSHS